MNTTNQKFVKGSSSPAIGKCDVRACANTTGKPSLYAKAQTQYTAAVRAKVELYANRAHLIPSHMRKNYEHALLRADFAKCSNIWQSARKFVSRLPSHVEPQFFSDVKRMITSVNTAAGNFNSMIEKFNNIIDYFTSQPETICSKLACLGSALVLYLKSPLDITSTIAFITLVATQFSVARAIVDTILKRWFGSSDPSVVAQAGKDDESNEIDTNLVGAVGDTFCFVFGLPSFKSCMDKLALTGRGITGLEKIKVIITTIVEWFRDQYSHSVNGCSWKEFTEREAFPRLKDYVTCSNLLPSVASKFTTDKDLCELALEMERVGFELFDLSRSNMQLRSYIASLQSRNLRYIDEARYSPMMAQSVRKLPFSLYVTGPPGVGKTNLLDILTARIYRKYCKNWKPGYAHGVFDRKVENDFWDGYNGEPIVKYDDICQRVDLKGTPNPEVAEIISVVNENIFHLHMAAIADKKNTYMTSEFVVASGNKAQPHIVSLEEPAAFYRRWKVCLMVSVKPEFGIKAKANQTDYMKVDPRKVTDPLRDDIYILQRYDMTTLNTIGEPMTCDECMEFLFGEIDHQRRYDALRVERKRQLCADAENAPPPDPEHVKKFAASINPQSFIERMEQGASLYGRMKDVMSKYTQKAITLAMDLSPNIGPSTLFADTWEKSCELAEKAGSKAMDIFVKLRDTAMSVEVPPALMFLTAAIPILLMTLFRNRACPLLKLARCEDLLTYTSCGCEDCEHGLMLRKNIDSHQGGPRAACYTLSHIAREPVSCALRRCVADEQATILTQVKRSVASRRRSPLDETARILFGDEVSGQALAYSTNTLAPGRVRVAQGLDYVAGTRAPGVVKTAQGVSYSTGTVRPVGKPTAQADPIITPITQQLVAQSVDLSCGEQQHKVVLRNSVVVRCGRAHVGGVFVTGRILLLPLHIIRNESGYVDAFEIVSPFHLSEGTTIRMKDCHIHGILDISGQPTDLALVSLPFRVVARPNIIGCFTEAKSLTKLIEGDVILTGIDLVRKDKVGVIREYRASLAELVTQKIQYSAESATGHAVEVTVPVSIRSKMPTRSGDCGSLLFANNTAIGKKILGMHVAGDVQNGEGYCVPLTSDCLARNVVVLQEMVQDSRHFVDASFSAQRYVEVDPEEAFRILGDIGDYVPIGKAPQAPSVMVSDISPSLISGAIYEPRTAPARLRPFVKDGVTVDPLIRGMAKVLNVQAEVESDILDIAVHDVTQLYRHTKKDLRRVLTHEEAIRGVDGYEFAAPVNRSTSPGWPYNLSNPDGGKHRWMGKDEDWKLDDPELKADVTKLIDFARQNKRGEVVFTATLKDERRTLERVRDGKTRVFEAAPQHYVVAVRQYFLGFVEHVMRNRIDNEICVGTNHLSMDWHKIGESLSSKGPNVFAGDFSGFDGSLLQEVLWKVCDIINDWYDDGPTNRQIRNVLFEEICNAFVIVRGVIIQQTHSQPSGNPLTTVVNSIFNQIVMRYAYLWLKREQGFPLVCDFREHVALQTYGDDNVLNVSSMTPWYNQESTKRALATIGLTYTDESKSGETVEYRTLSEVNFLKRSFVRGVDGLFKGPLEIAVIREIPNWIKGKQKYLATEENVKATFLDLALHGKDVYNREMKLLQQACAKIEGLTIRFPHFAEYEDLMRSHRGQQEWHDCEDELPVVDTTHRGSIAGQSGPPPTLFDEGEMWDGFEGAVPTI